MSKKKDGTNLARPRVSVTGVLLTRTPINPEKEIIRHQVNISSRIFHNF